jgi:hypothetical protein
MRIPPHNEPYCDQCEEYHRAPTKTELSDGFYWIDQVMHMNFEHPAIKRNCDELAEQIDKEILEEILKEFYDGKI